MVTFIGTPQDAMEGFRKKLSWAKEENHVWYGSVQDPLFRLVGLRDRVAVTGFDDKELLEQFRQESGAALLQFKKQVMAYADITVDAAEIAEPEDWYHLCMRRSIIQILIEDYADMPVAKLVNLEDVEELDEELHRVGLEQKAIAEENIPRGLPDSHWWWRYPDHKGE